MDDLVGSGSSQGNSTRSASKGKAKAKVRTLSAEVVVSGLRLSSVVRRLIPDLGIWEARLKGDRLQLFTDTLVSNPRFFSLVSTFLFYTPRLPVLARLRESATRRRPHYFAYSWHCVGHLYKQAQKRLPQIYLLRSFFAPGAWCCIQYELPHKNPYF